MILTLSFGAPVLSFACAIYVVGKAGINRITTLFVLLCGVSISWQTNVAFMLQAKDPATISFLERYGFIPIPFLPTLLYHFLVETTQRRRDLPFVYFSYLIDAAFSMTIAAGFNWYFDGTRQYAYGLFIQAGSLYFIHVAQTFLVVLRGLVLTYTGMRRSDPSQKRRLRWCFWSICVYLCAAVDYLRNYGFPYFTPGVLFASCSLCLIAFAVGRHNILGPMRMAAAIAHEMRTPLAIMEMQLSVLFEKFELARLQQPPSLRAEEEAKAAYRTRTTRSAVKNSVEEAFDAIRRELQRAHATIDMLLAATQMNQIDTSRFGIHRIKPVILSAIERYPFQPRWQGAVRTEHLQDFDYKGSVELLEMVILNLLDNAIHAIAAAHHEKPCIQLHTERGEHVNRLIVTDNGTGKYSMQAALVTEFVMTAVFLFIIMGATDAKANARLAPVAIGLALTLIHLISIPVTNTSVNPARSTGVAVFAGGWAVQQLWLFWIAPMAGAVAGALAYRALRED
jgi:two-component system, CAI-1 autoinducer sensor kinase/phosphatase CqsS